MAGWTAGNDLGILIEAGHKMDTYPGSIRSNNVHTRLHFSTGCVIILLKQMLMGETQWT